MVGMQTNAGIGKPHVVHDIQELNRIKYEIEHLKPKAPIKITVILHCGVRI